ncbi:MAG: T9SS type A sorting domain-containing protein, partial [Ignavibacteria bacterium]
LGGVNAEGKAYLYFGGTAMNNIPDFIFTGESLGDGFGTSVSSAGDVNKDGFSDIIIGAYHNGANDFNSGRAYIYFGGNPPDNIPDATFTGQASSDLFGVSVSSAGDVNNDGFSDMVVGAMGSCAVGYEMGRAYLYAGGDEINSANDKKNILTEDYQLFQSYPNPFNPETKITFSLPENSDINLVVYDILGREIITLENNELASGYYERSWRGIDASGKQVSSGIYFYRLNARGKSGKEYSKVMKMVMVK